MIYYCDDLPHPTREHEAFIEKGVERLLEILSISNGKALVLFTAKADMEEVYSILGKKNLPYKILMQQPGSSQDKVLNEFKEDTNSVLLGTGAYWEGISIEGKSLSNVIIFRLPFPVPDPIIEYKCSVAKDALMDVRVPEMIIKLKQGIGRLIRNFTDTGMSASSTEDCGMSRRNAIMTLHGTPCLSKIGQAVWTNLGSFTKVCPRQGMMIQTAVSSET